MLTQVEAEERTRLSTRHPGLPPAAQPGSTPVLFVVGSGRSGSTVLANLLGAASRHISVGEVRFLWERAILAGRPCGCGKPVRECALWGPVLERAFPDGVNAARVAAELREATRMRETLRLLAPGGRSRLARRRPHLLDALQRLYAALGEQTGGRVIVDSSKLPTYALLLGALPGVRLTLLHLVRDPRAAAWSWQRVKPLSEASPGATMQRQSPLKSALLWTAWNAVARLMGTQASSPYRRVRYEDFVRQPRELTSSILALSGDAAESLPFVDDRCVKLGVSHSAAGNPNRMDSGEITLCHDAEWVERLSRRDRLLVTASAAPLMAAWGYRLGRRTVR